MTLRAALASCYLALLIAGGVPAIAAGMSVNDLVAALDREAAALEPSAWVRADFGRLARDHGIPSDEATLRQYLRVKLVFEAVREAGWWRIAWDITDREPRSDEIWAAWRELDGRVPLVTATAECDESAALAAFLLRRLGVPSVGLLWPTSNHTVAVWKVRRSDGGDARIVLPTSQVFLEPGDGLDTRAFDGHAQRKVYDYGREDVAGTATIPAALGAFFLESIRAYAGASGATQRELRILRSRLMAGEPSDALESDRQELARTLREAPEADIAALERFRQELDHGLVSPVSR